MSLLTDLVQRCRGFLRGEREDAETQEELQFHLEMQTEKNLRAGMDPRQARRQAHVRLGGVDAIREAVRDARGARPLDDLFRDLGYALRGARRHHGFTLVAVLTLTLGIGANTAVFTVVDNFLFRPPPFEHVERLVSIRDVNPAQGWMVEDNVAASPGNFLDWREQGRSFDHLVAWRNWFYSVAGPEGRNPIPEQIRGVRISPSFFAMLGVQAAHGRTFLPEEEVPGRDRVVILSDGLWRRRYGGDPTIVGETLLMDGRPFTVVGVLPRDFHFLQTDFDLWMPFAVDEDFRGRDEHSISVWGRLAPGVSLEAAQTEFDAITRRLEAAYPDTNEGWGAAIVPIYPPSYGGAIERALLLLLGAVGCVLLIACANVANLLLVRAGARRRELALRAALGASRGRLVRQLLAESGLLAVLGGAGGLVLAAVGVRLLAPLLPVIGTYTHPSLRIDLRVLGFMVVAVLVTTVLFGLWPAVRTSRTETLRVAGSSGQWSAGRALLVVELALSVMLLAGAALLIQSLWNLQRVDPGFRTERLLTMQVWLPERKYPSPSGVRTFSDEMLRRVEALPGVRSASTVNTRPFLGWFLGLDVEVPGYVPPETIEGGDLLTYRVVSNLYFETLGAELVQGRAFSTGDGAEGAAVAVVNEAAAARYWPDVEPIGRQFRPPVPAGRGALDPRGEKRLVHGRGGGGRLPRESDRRASRPHRLSVAAPEPVPPHESGRRYAGGCDWRSAGDPARDPGGGRRPRRLRPQDDGRHPLRRGGVAAAERVAALAVRGARARAVCHRRPRRHVVPRRAADPRVRDPHRGGGAASRHLPDGDSRDRTRRGGWHLVGAGRVGAVRARGRHRCLRGRAWRRDDSPRRVRRRPCRGPRCLLPPRVDGHARRSHAGAACRVRLRWSGRLRPSGVSPPCARCRRGRVPAQGRVVGGPGNAIRRCIQAAATDPDLAAEAWTEPDPLTNRQRHVLRLARESSQERPWTTSRAVED